MIKSTSLALPLARYRVAFTGDTPPRFSDFPGSAWRGALGHAFKQTVCVTRAPRCADCLLYRSCSYSYFFDTPPAFGASKMRRYESVPHPYVLEPDDAAGGESYRLGFAIIGQANRHLPVFLHALTESAQGPKGVAGNSFIVSDVQQEAPICSDGWQSIYNPEGGLAALPPASPIVPDAPSDCEIQLQTPLRVKRAGRHVGPRDFRFVDLFGNLLRRVSMLTAHHTDTPLETNFRELIDAAHTIDCDARLSWRELTRYSARQKAAMQMGGVVGTISLGGQDLAPFWPYLWLGQWIHAGSGATMGLGRYRIAASLPHAPVASDASNIAA